MIYFRGLFSDKKEKLVYSNGLSQVHLPSPFTDGGNRTAYKTCLKLSIETQKTQVSQRRCRSKYCRMAKPNFNKYGTKKANIVASVAQQTQINPKYNKDKTLIT